MLPGIMLSPAQIRHFHEHGWIAPLDAFDEEAVERNRATFAGLRAQVGDAYAINGCHSSCRSIWDLATHPALVAAVRDLLGDELLVWGSHFFSKEPGDARAVAWHQDGPYWPFTPLRTVTAWIAIDDSTVGNSAMRVIPGSHRLGVLPYRALRADEPDVLSRALDGVDALPAPVSVELRAGQFSLHHDLLVHGSLPNRSTRRRCGLTVRYCPPAVTAPEQPGWMHAAIRVSGDAPAAAGWRFVPRPADDAIQAPELVIGAN